jgi:hypothetical protein
MSMGCFLLGLLVLPVISPRAELVRDQQPLLFLGFRLGLAGMLSQSAGQGNKNRAAFGRAEAAPDYSASVRLSFSMSIFFICSMASMAFWDFS